MTEGALPLATRRVRRQRRLQQRLGGSPFLSDARYRQVASSLAVIIALAFGVSTLVNQATGPQTAIPMDQIEEPEAVAAYNADALRPDLGPADEAGIPMPASYAVASGDTLLSVAYRFGSTVEAIRLANNLDDADALSLGSSLVVPPPRSVLHPVDPSLPSADIAEAFEVAPDLFAAYNGMAADAINEPIGREVVILPAAVLGLPAEQLAEPARVEVATTLASSPDSSSDTTMTYTVAEGDTILAIAQKLGVEPSTIVTANRLSDSDLIVVGDALAVPLWSRPARDNGQASGAGTKATTASAADALERAIERPSAPFVYELEPGDTLQDVAWKFGVDVYTLVNNNELANADLVRAGTQLTVLPVSGLMYTVEPGDTLESIARTYKVDLGPIIDFNYLEDADFIAVGKDLILPGAAPLPPPAPAPSLPTTYTVLAGDTVGGIARSFGVTADDIVSANGMRTADRISVGQSLRIAPGAAGIARPAPAVAPPARSAPAAQTVTRNLPVPAQAPAQQAPVAPSSASGSIVNIAMQFRGYRYVFGGTTPAGFDCSGFVYYVLNRAGKPISRGMWGQYGAGAHPGRGSLQPGDIVFFQNTYMAGLSHNGIYIGNGQFIHASDPSSGVKISSLSESYWASRWFGATRV